MTITEWAFPTNILIGAKSFAGLDQCFKQTAITSVMVITDSGLSQSPSLKKLLKRIDKLKLSFGVFSILDGAPDQQTLELTVRLYLSGGFNGILAFGSGSAIDLAKLTRLFSAKTSDVKQLRAPDAYDPLPALIAVPTLAGSGAEVQEDAYMVDRNINNGFSVYDKRLCPTFVIADPLLTATAPASFIAGSGMNALVNAIDSWCSPAFNPVADALALETVKLVFANLEKAVNQPSLQEAHLAMLSASICGALAATKSIGATTALARSVCHRYQTHFGMTAGVLLPYVLAYNQSIISDKIDTLARHLDIKGGFNGFARHLLALRKAINIPTKLTGLTKDQKIKVKDKTLIENVAVEDLDSGDNAIRLTKKAAFSILNAAIAGKMNRKK
ncbi:iron-containing alcohol dehydrogenase [uncultured Bartonella sp.]|uniref:iron-containing alcohol dehydrogenase n=1 Tax=uncultured Bartonella sp. TaxID=104108 RepID=UPI002626D269|nr:iron-containing alcohol dehydrogenase [uncultured Bartonella sp.]